MTPKEFNAVIWTVRHVAPKLKAIGLGWVNFQVLRRTHSSLMNDLEIDPKLVEISRQIAREAEVADKVVFLEGDLFTVDISAATVVTLFLSPGVNKRLEPKLRRELRPGTRIVSHQFGIGSWPADKTVRAVEDGTDLFLWRITAQPQTAR